MTHSVHEIKKPSWQPCSHLCENGCGIYDERPSSCKDYSCIWLDGWGDESCKPNTLGACFEVQNTLFGETIVCKVVDAGAIAHKPLQSTINHFAEDCIVWVQFPSESTRMIVHPPHLKEVVLDRVDKFIPEGVSWPALGSTVLEAIESLGRRYGIAQ